MSLDSIYGLLVFSLYLPGVMIAVILVHYLWLRKRWKSGKRLGYYPSAFALGLAFQFMQCFHRPSVAHVIEAKRNEEADEDQNGDPETKHKHLHRQLRRIRRGEEVGKLVVRL